VLCSQEWKGTDGAAAQGVAIRGCIRGGRGDCARALAGWEPRSRWPSLKASSAERPTIWHAVFHFPSEFTFTACRGSKHRPPSANLCFLPPLDGPTALLWVMTRSEPQAHNNLDAAVC